MKKFVTILLIFITLAGVIYFTLPQVVDPIDKNLYNNTTLGISQEEEQLITLSHSDAEFDISDIDDALQTDETQQTTPLPDSSTDILFIEMDSQSTQAQTIQPKEGLEPSSAIKISQNSISKIQIGDTITLPLLDNTKYQAKISNKITYNNGSISVTGNLIDTNNKYSIILTEGKQNTFGSITTPEGAYEIEVVNGQGYVYAVEDIETQRIDYGHSDVIDIHKHP